MEYLVSMVTNVPAGTPEQGVEEIKAREAAHTAELAARGSVLRLWRPPLQPGEWRTFGLFAAASDDELNQVLTSMPLRVWRTDETEPLRPHPNDPGLPGRAPLAVEYLVTMTSTVPDGTPEQTVALTEAGEAVRARELAVEGHLMRLWALPGQRRALGLWSADDENSMQAVFESLPLYDWLTIDTVPLSPHPSDPALARG